MLILIFSRLRSNIKVNNLIVQGFFENIESHHKASSPKKKKFGRSFLPRVSETRLQYYQKKRVGPPVLTFAESEACEFIFDDANDTFCGF